MTGTMKENPRIITRGRRTEPAGPREFSFNEGQIQAVPENNLTLHEYRRRAWEAFKSLPVPTPAEDAWRRTDIRALKAESFRLPVKDAYLDLPSVPEHHLTPLADRAHGGEVVLLAGGAKVRLEEKLSSQGVIFTDLQTAHLKYPAIVEKILGKAVKP